jgi:hypothetical protein
MARKDCKAADAIISSCGRYRYSLRRWLQSAPGHQVVFVMLNPSTATATEDDPTIRRCVNYAKRWVFGQLEVVNLFALRSTDPDKLWSCPPISVGPENDAHIEKALRRSQLVVCAWGAPKSSWALERAQKVLAAIKAAGHVPHALKMTKDGFPGHPLYLPAKLVPFAMEAS